MSDIFLSYCRDDLEIARRLAHAFEREGFSVWWDAELIPGEAFDQVIEKALGEAKAVVVLWSRKSVASRWVRAEATQASENRTLIPVLIEPCKRPIIFELTHTVDLSHWKGEPQDPAWQACVAGIRRLVGADSAAPTQEAGSAAPPRHGSSMRLGGVLLLVVIIAAAVGWAIEGRHGNQTPAQAGPADAPRAVTAGSVAAVAAAAPPEHAIAVLPFVNISGDKNNEYFSDGLSEELIDLLTRIPGLQVPARTSSFYFKGKQATIPEIARALNVSYVLEGSVRKSGNALRITAQLIRADNGYDVWSRTFDRQLTDIFRIQDDIAGAVVRALKVSLLEGTAPKAQLTRNTDAYTLYLQALAISRSGAPEDIQTAIRDLQKAVMLDDRFTAAWSALAYALVIDLGWHSATPYQQSCKPAYRAADRALELQPANAGAHEVSGYLMQVCDWDWSGAEAQYKQALALDPGDAGVLTRYSQLAYTLNRTNEAVQLAQDAVARDPLNAATHVQLGNAQSGAGNFAAADASYQRALVLMPGAHGPHALLAYERVAAHRPAEALQAAQEEPDQEFRQVVLPMTLQALGRTREADAAFATLISTYPDHEAITIGEYYACRKDNDDSIKWLDRNFSQHLAMSDQPPLSTCLNNLRGDPRYVALRRRMRLPP